jgi:hypothetical protein
VNTRQSAQVFGLTKSTGNVEGEAIRYAMTDTGTFAALSPDALEYSAWEELSDDEKQAVCADVRTGGFVGFFRKDGAS